MFPADGEVFNLLAAGSGKVEGRRVPPAVLLVLVWSVVLCLDILELSGGIEDVAIAIW